MMPALYSGISGLNAHQLRMNTIGNNVANVNTIGFKSSMMTFKESFAQTIRSPDRSTPGLQYGLGVNLGGVTRRFTAGMLQETGLQSNMAVNGEGFFVVENRAGQQLLSRAGDFVMDLTEAGEINLITPDGHVLLGSDGTDLVPIDLTPASGEALASFSVASDGKITLVDVTGAKEVLGGEGTEIKVKVAMFQNNNGLNVEGQNLYSWTVAAGGTGVDGGYNVDAAGTLLQGYLEASNTDLAREFTDMIVSQRGFQANARTVTTSDEILNELMNVKR